MDTKAAANPWYIAADNTDNKYYDIRAFQTDKDVDASGKAAWNWHGGASSNTSNTMGWYDYTDGNSGWGIVLAGGSASPVADRKIVALYNVPNDENLYALYNSSGTPKVSSTTGTTPQYFVLRHNGLDYQGEALYKIQKAECDGKYLHFQDFNAEAYNYTFLNTSSYFYSRYTYSSGTAAVSPYYNLFRIWPNSSDNSSRPYSNQVSLCNDAVVDMFSGGYSTISAPLNDKGKWNGRWKVVTLSGYTAWQVIITGTSSGAVTYTGPGLYSGATTQQSNDGIFVLTSATNPSSSDFTPSAVDGCCIDPTVTVDNTRKVVKVTYSDYTEAVNYLSNTPEGIGYPTSAVRDTYQSAIDFFNASEKTSSDLSTLNTALNTFKNTNTINLPEVGKVYRIQSYVKSPSKIAYIENKENAFTISSDASATELENLWIVRKSGDKVVLQSATNQDKYIIYSNPGLSTTGSDWTLSKGTEWPYISMYNASLGGGRYVACDPTNGYFGTVVTGKNYYAGSKTQSSGWSTDFKFVESDAYKLITYNLKWGETTLESQEALVAIGSAPSSPWSAPDYCDFSYGGVETIAANTTSVDVSLDWDGPFDISPDYANAVWYLMKINGTKWVSTGTTSDGVTPIIGIDNTTDTSADLWAFIGNPYEGIRLINKSTGDGYYGHANASLTMESGETNTLLSIAESETSFFLKNSSGLYMELYNDNTIGFTYAEPYLNFNKITVQGPYYYDLYMEKLALYEASADKVFGPTQSALDSYKAAVDASAIKTESYYNTAVSALNGIAKIYPEEGKYYVVKNVGTNKYLHIGAENDDFGQAGLYDVLTTSTLDASCVVRISKSDSKSYFNGQGLQYSWASASPNETTGNARAEAAPGKYAHYNVTTPGQAGLAFVLGNGEGGWSSYTANSYYRDNGSGVVIGGTYDNDNAQWTMEEISSIDISLTAIGDYTYATLGLPFGVTLPADVKAYILTVSGDWAIPTEISEVPAGTGVLLRGTSSSVTSATLTINDAASATTDGNKLVPTYVDITAARSDGEYILGNGEDGLGFYQRKSGRKIGANKAYLQLDADLAVKGLLLNFDIATGIDGLTPDTSLSKKGEEIFNLAGQRMSRVQKGVNIVNGKKVLVK